MTATITPLDVAVKAAITNSKWDENDHPRDRRGRFIETGARVRIGFGSMATVVRNVGKGRIEVTRDSDNRNVTVSARVLIVVEGPDGKKPTTDRANVARHEAREAVP